MAVSNIVYMDTQTASLADHAKSYIGSSISKNPVTDERLYDQYMREHETGHQILGLKEAGADYVAATRLLQTNPGPESKDFLQRMADLRTVAPFRALDDNVGNTMLNYGYGCSTAIQAALHTPPEELKNMTAEQMYDNGHHYDQVNGMATNHQVGSVRPEMAVRRAMLEIDPEMASADKYSDAKITASSQKLLDSGRFADGTPEHQVLEDLNAASKRIDAVVAQTSQSSNLQPAVKPSIAPAVAP